MLSGVKEGFSSVGSSLCCKHNLPPPDLDRVKISENDYVSRMVQLNEASQVDEVQVSDEKEIQKSSTSTTQVDFSIEQKMICVLYSIQMFCLKYCLSYIMS